jgi:hypothetical protein
MVSIFIVIYFTTHINIPFFFLCALRSLLFHVTYIKEYAWQVLCMLPSLRAKFYCIFALC